MTDYQAGTCNINQTERKKRLVVGAAGFANGSLLTIILAVIPSLKILYAAIFFLYMTGFLGYFQYQHHFCTGLALKKKFKTGNSEEEVDDPEQVTEDRKKAAEIILQSILASGLLTTGIYLTLANI